MILDDYSLNFHQKVLLFNSYGRFLILRASYKNRQWDLPGGGVELPEEAEAALLREVEEETGIGILSNVTPVIVQSAFDRKSRAYVLFVGYKAWTSEESVRLSCEHSEFRWADLSTVRRLQFPDYLRQFINDKASTPPQTRTTSGN